MNLIVEYGSQGIVSVTGDVYSFGILMMETFTRKKPTDNMFEEGTSLKLWVKEALPDSDPVEGSRESCRDHQFYKDSYNANEMQLKVSVTRQPISAYINTDGDFKQYTIGIYNGNCRDSINHAVVIVGYGVSEYDTKYWILKNSWGTGWGECGYMRIIRESGFPKGPCGILTIPPFPDAQ
ncbi:hypothetical protein LWI29_016104 [Acer saccharum]|uniref:Peptidase C1A papain C-terminal domain-containing protein n=1 Tax=Acer saccharum TaxID=4024 RepID=A0AA39RS46_ACESA|nr:hypothetical protein LWI29_016104 [Acer saccharum]